MKITSEAINKTKVKLDIQADLSELALAKKQALTNLARNVRVPGFRAGSAPAAMVEKQLDPNVLAEETLNLALNAIYSTALIQEKLRAVNNPEISVTVYVPYTQLEFSATLDIVGKLSLGQYKDLNVAKDMVNVSSKEVNQVIERLRNQLAMKNEVDRAAKNGDEVVLDFKGVDTKTKEPISGADGKDYPLILGSNSFIPGFEDQLIGLKKDETKDFDITFPEDYGATNLRKKQVSFNVSIKSVNERSLPTVDDAMAKLVGPFTTLSELKADIKKELSTNAEREAASKQQNELLEKIVSASNVDIPEALIDEETDRLEREQRQNATYGGLTWKEYLERDNLDETSFKELAKQQALIRIKTGLILGEIAAQENITVTEAELDAKMDELKSTYTGDQAMQTELKKPENRQDIKNRLMVEKTIEYLVSVNKK